jgi:hypothetical protein
MNNKYVLNEHHQSVEPIVLFRILCGKVGLTKKKQLFMPVHSEPGTEIRIGKQKPSLSRAQRRV